MSNVILNLYSENLFHVIWGSFDPVLPHFGGSPHIQPCRPSSYFILTSILGDSTKKTSSPKFGHGSRVCDPTICPVCIICSAVNYNIVCFFLTTVQEIYLTTVQEIYLTPVHKRSAPV